jgi:glycosyltransferase involved in cell wall biosynthesis
MTAPRLLVVAHAHPAFVAGGTELLAHDLFKAWRDAGREASFLGAVTRLHREPRGLSSLQAAGTGPDEFLVHVEGFDDFTLSQRDPAAFVHGFGRLLARVAPQVVHFHHFSRIGIDALMMVRRLAPEARIVATLHDYHLICANGGLMTTTSGALCTQASSDACHACFANVPTSRFALRRQHLANLLGLVDVFVAPSRFIKARHVAWGVPDSRIEVIGNAVPEAAPGTRFDGDVPETPHRFGMFANLSPHKGALLAIEAARRIPTDQPFSLHLHGADLYREPGFTADLSAALAAAGPRVVAGGAYARDSIAQLMAGVDWVVVPSTWWENAPLVILEAFRHRKPVITADIGGMAEMVRDGVEGLRFRAGDPADLARVMRRAAGDRALWSRLRTMLPVPPTPRDLADAHLDLYARIGARGTALSA